MSKISEHNLYNIDDLNQVWKGGGWKALAECDDNLDVGYIICRGPQQIMTIFDEIYNDMGSEQCDAFEQVAWKVDELVILAAIPKGILYSSQSREEYSSPNGVWGYEDAKLWRLLKVVITAFVDSKSLGDALSKVNEENWQRFAKYWFDSETKGWIDILLSVRIDGRWVEAMKWLLYAFRNKDNYEETIWNCVWIFTKPMITELMKLKKCIIDDIPLTDEQLIYLDDLMEEAHPYGSRNVRCNGSETYEVYLVKKIKDSPFFFDRNINFLRNTARVLLIQPAFNLAQELQRKCLKPRFVRRCRAPSCGKRFYTGRDNATACTNKGSGAKSACALEWIRYKRFLMKISKDPEKDWDNEQLQKDFISYNKS